MFAVLSPARNLLGRLLLLLSIIGLAACEPVALGTGGGGASINPSDPVPVALLVPHGSSNGGEAALARDLEAAARMAVADLQGVQIDLRVYGTAGQAAQAQTAARNAVADGAKIIIGPLHAEAANAAALAVAPQNVNVLAFSNNTTIAGGNLFILGTTFDTIASRLMRYASRQGKSRVVSVYSNNLAGRLGQDAIARAASASGASVVGAVPYEFSQQGVLAAVPRIVSAAQTGNADTVFMTANTAGALPLFSQMLPESSLDPATTQFIGLTRWDQPSQTLELPGVQGGWFALPDPQKNAQFNARFQAANGRVPHTLAGLAYDGIAAVGALARKGQRDALSRANLTQGAGFSGAGGVFRLRSDGTNERGLAIATARNRQLRVLDPAPTSFGGAGF